MFGGPGQQRGCSSKPRPSECTHYYLTVTADCLSDCPAACGNSGIRERPCALQLEHCPLCRCRQGAKAENGGNVAGSGRNYVSDCAQKLTFNFGLPFVNGIVSIQRCPEGGAREESPAMPQRRGFFRLPCPGPAQQGQILLPASKQSDKRQIFHRRTAFIVANFATKIVEFQDYHVVENKGESRLPNHPAPSALGRLFGLILQPTSGSRLPRGKMTQTACPSR